MSRRKSRDEEILEMYREFRPTQKPSDRERIEYLEEQVKHLNNVVDILTEMIDTKV